MSALENLLFFVETHGNEPGYVVMHVPWVTLADELRQELAELQALRTDNARLRDALADLQREWDSYRDNVQSGQDGAAARAANETWQAFGEDD